MHTKHVVWTNNKLVGEEREVLLAIVSGNIIVCVEINLAKEVKDFYNKNFEALKKVIEEDTRKQEDTPEAYELEELIWKWVYYWKLPTDSAKYMLNFNDILHRIS